MSWSMDAWLRQVRSGRVLGEEISVPAPPPVPFARHVAALTPLGSSSAAGGRGRAEELVWRSQHRTGPRLLLPGQCLPACSHRAGAGCLRFRCDVLLCARELGIMAVWAQLRCRAASTARAECGRLLRLTPGQQQSLPAPAAAGDANNLRPVYLRSHVVCA